MACAIRRIGRNLRGYDAAIWNCRYEIAATPQLRFAQLRPLAARSGQETASPFAGQRHDARTRRVRFELTTNN